MKESPKKTTGEEFKEHIGENRITYTVLLLLILAFAVWGVARETGFRLTGSGSVEILNVPQNSEVKVDNRLLERVLEGMSTISTDLSPKAHTVTIQRHGYWPWTKTVPIEKNMNTSVSPFLIPQQPVVTEIDFGSNEYWSAVNLFNTSSGTSEFNKSVSKSENVHAWISGASILAQWEEDKPIPHFFCSDTCSTEVIVTPIHQNVSHIDFFQNREDVLLMTTPDGVFAIEIDSRGTQNFQPLYQEGGADFRIDKNGSVYILDGDSLFILDL